MLLLDEPTNHLDLPGILQLKEYLNTLDGPTVVTVSHDRAFLDDTVDDVIELRGGALTYYTGNYSRYCATMAEDKAKRAAQRDALDRKAQKQGASVTKQRAAAARSADCKRQAQAASKARKLEQRHGLEVNAKGHRFKLNRDRAGAFQRLG